LQNSKEENGRVLQENETNLSDQAESLATNYSSPPIENRNKRSVFLGDLLLWQPLIFITYCATFFAIFFQFLVPKHYPDTLVAGWQSIMIAVMLAPAYYLAWLSYCLVTLMWRFFLLETPITKLSSVLGLYVGNVWIVSTMARIKLLFRYIVNSALDFEMWGLLVIFVILIMGMLVQLLRMYLLVLSYGGEDLLNTIQDRELYIKKTFLCFITLVFTIVVVYLF